MRVLFDTPAFIAPYQSKLGEYFPHDALFGLGKSLTLSSAATFVMTRGNLLSAMASHPFAAASSLIYMVAMAVFKYAVPENIYRERMWEVQAGSALLAMTVAHLFGNRIGVQQSLWWSCVFTLGNHFVMQLFSPPPGVSPVFIHVAL